MTLQPAAVLVVSCLRLFYVTQAVNTEKFFDDCRPDTAQSAGDEGMVAFYG